MIANYGEIILNAYAAAQTKIRQTAAHGHRWRPNKGTCVCACGAIHYTQMERLIPMPGAASIVDSGLCGCIDPVVHPLDEWCPGEPETALWQTT